jgi:hypothetical protein
MFDLMDFEMRFKFGPIRAVRAGELRLDPTLVALMAPKTPPILVDFGAGLTGVFTWNCTIKKKLTNCQLYKL